MAHFSFNLLHSLEPKRYAFTRLALLVWLSERKLWAVELYLFLKYVVVLTEDSYGFALRPQYAQTYREYSSIYKEEEDERSDKWSDFLEQVAESSEPTSENEHKDTLKAEPESNEVREERNPHKLSNGDDSSGRQFSELEEETIVVRKSAEGNEIIEETIQDRVSKGGDSSDRTTSGGTEIKEGTSPGRVSEGDDSSGRNFICYSATGNNSGKEQHHSEERKTCEVQRWAEIRPSLITIEEIFSSRIKKGKQMKGGKINGINVHLPSIEESEPVDDGINGSRAENALVDQNLPELFSRWKELESLVQGGVPKDLRGEVWQAFVGVKKRRVESYYEDLLARDESEEQDVSSAAFGKWKKQIEKDLPRTFPGHPALDENGRNSLRRLLLAYARHNPEVGYCQAMNFFAGLLLLLMPEENAFWAFAGIIDEYFAGYYTEDMIESQVDQLIFEELMRERFPKLVNHLDYLGVQVAWISGSWFLSIFVNIIPWESVLRVWDVLLFEGNRVMLFRTALALMELYGPALVTTKDAGDAITLFQSLVGSTFDSSQLVFTACMGYLAVTEARLKELREKHLPSVLDVIEERSKKGRAWKDSKGLASKLYSFKHDPGSLEEERILTEGSDTVADGNVQLESHSSNLDEMLNSLNVDSEVGSLPHLQEQVVWLKVELCRLMEEKRSAILRAEELETALMEMVKEDNRLQLSARVEQLEQEVAELQQVIADKKEQEAAMLQVLVRLEQDQKVTEDARRRSEQDLAAHKFEVHVLQEKYDKAMQSIAEMQKRVVMAESMLEATLQYESGQSKALSSPRTGRVQSPRFENPTRKVSLLSFGLGWRDKNKGKPNAEESSESLHDHGSPRKESDNQ
ncbi:TBC1 domain family member 9 [Glycine soja]